MRVMRVILCVLLLFSTAACEDTVWRSAVPSYPVQLTINTQQGIYVHFVPSNINACCIIDRDGYHFNGQTLPLTMLDYYGYAGVIVYIDGNGQYSAFDMACPKCLSRQHPVEQDGMFATCPLCGEQYDLSYGYATPSQGISREPLRKYTTLYSNGILTIRN